MIKNLNGLHETVTYRADTQICLHYNENSECYPPHWHTPFELIMPTENSYRVRCGETEYLIQPGEILIICPGILHELFAPEHGKRIIFQPNLGQLRTKELELLTSMIRPAILITPESFPQIYARVHRMMLEIKNAYFSDAPFTETTIYARFLEILVLVGRSHAENTQQRFDARKNIWINFLQSAIILTSILQKILRLRRSLPSPVSANITLPGCSGSMQIPLFISI